MNKQPKIEIVALINQLETYRIDQEYKLELGQALMLGAAMGLRQQYEKIGILEKRVSKLEKINDEMAARLKKAFDNELF